MMTATTEAKDCPTNGYGSFLEAKRQLGGEHGFEPIWLPDFLFDFQRSLVEWAIRKGRAALFEDCGMGKGQPPDSPVLTPTGWRPIGSLVPGDRVISSNGKPCTVKGVYFKPVQDTFRVHFSDGASLVVDLDHLHICRTNNDRQRGKPWRVLSTADLLSCGNLRYGSEDKSRNYDIPVVSDVEFEASDLPIDPYVVGALLGDGHFGRAISLSSNDRELLEEFDLRLPSGVSLSYRGKYDWRLNTGSVGPRMHPFRKTFDDLGLLGSRSETKAIPDAYLFASPSDRLWLLRGLMDTDGHIAPGGCCQFYSVSSRLADGVVHLIRSLGGVPTRSLKQTSCDGKPGQPCHVITFSLATHNPFFLPRKAERWNPTPRDNGRWIDRIEFEKRQKTVCIAVDSEDSSYVTDHFIVTHNTAQFLVWAENVARKFNRPVLVLTPLAVGAQTVSEAAKFGIEAIRSLDGSFPAGARIIVANYERLQHFSPSDFAGVVCDESSILKSFNGKTKAAVTEFMRTIPCRLLCTATAAPNDYVELGTSSEALGYMGFQDMATIFFLKQTSKDHLGWGRTKYRLRGHATRDFWRWVCSWARAVRKPSDLGFDDGPFTLPPLVTREHVIQARTSRPGFLFDMPAMTLPEEREERRRTLKERCQKVADLIGTGSEPAIAWCHLNDEGDELTRIISGAEQVSGSDSDERKEELFEAFRLGQVRVLVTKSQIAGFGLNWQHCARMTFFPSHSFEQWYQSIRRCWRFGQTRPVIVDVVASEGEAGVLGNLKSKAEAAEAMFASLVGLMSDELKVGRSNPFTKEASVPSWLSPRSPGTSPAIAGQSGSAANRPNPVPDASVA